MKQQTVAIFTGPEGHYSLAMALKQRLEKKYKVVLFYERDFLFNFYTPIYQLFPQVNSVPFFISHKLTKNARTADLLFDLFRRRYAKKFEFFLKKNKPIATMSTYFMYNAGLQHYQKTTNIPFFNVLTDPRTIHPLLISPQATTNLSFDQQTVDYSKKLNAQAQYTKIGWFVREQFDQPYDQTKVRKQLKLDPKKLTILVTSGSEGTSMILKVLPALFLTSVPVQVVVACGNNKTLYKSIEAFRKIIQSRNHQGTLIPLGYTEKLHQYMQAADLVIGKAGPNTLFESVATKTPFFAITHIAGQEDGNIELIRQYQLGYAEENPLKIQSLFKSILEHPEQLDIFKKPIAQMAAYNSQATAKVEALIEQQSK